MKLDEFCTARKRIEVVTLNEEHRRHVRHHPIEWRVPTHILYGILEIFANSKLKLIHKDLLEGIQIILLIEYQHCLLVIDRIN